MASNYRPAEIGADDFSRRFSRRAANLMWLPGAGASASAGIPTAWDMVWEFKQLLFVSQRRVSPQAVADLSSPIVRAQLQAHIDCIEGLLASGAADEYAALFEAVYPAEADRRAYIDSKISGAKPSYGHIALATLMRTQLARLVWTPNFDPLIADACAKVYDTRGSLTTVTLEAPDLAAQVITEGRWPAEIKLHGDFRSRRLKNTPDELRQQDVRLRQMLVESCGRYGLVVIGYSGRDDSIMDALAEAVERSGAFPAGLFWLHRGEYPPLPRVTELLAKAAAKEIEAALVQIENFDEAFRDIIRLVDGVDTSALDAFAKERQRWSAAPRPIGKSGWPVLRLNALPVVQAPSVCRRVECQIGGYSELRKAVENARVDVLTARNRRGILAFGADADMRAAFDQYGITQFDLYPIEPNRLKYDSAERGLLREALARAITRERSLNGIRRGNVDLLTPADHADPKWMPLRRLVGSLAGGVPDYAELSWREGIATRVDWADDRLWFLIEPRTVFDGITDGNRAGAADFARERSVGRYNRQLNDLISFWANILAGDGDELRALGTAAGVDAIFRLSPETGFSRRTQL